MKTLLGLALVGSMLLSACASAPSTQYYQLSSHTYQFPSHQAPMAAVKVVLAEPLKSNSLLYQYDEQTVHFAKQHLWAEPLDVAAAKHLANSLNTQSSQWRFVPSHLQNNNMPQLVVYLERFQGRFDGYAQISGYSVWQNKQGALQTRNFNAQIAQQGDGYAAMSQALNMGLVEVSKQIAP